ncbi:PSL5 [Scenedesmus sp. PABB004]|nr:PSL5 [Scenedesmus sp. PABB004]
MPKKRAQRRGADDYDDAGSVTSTGTAVSHDGPDCVDAAAEQFSQAIDDTYESRAATREKAWERLVAMLRNGVRSEDCCQNATTLAARCQNALRKGGAAEAASAATALGLHMLTLGEPNESLFQDVCPDLVKAAKQGKGGAAKLAAAEALAVACFVAAEDEGTTVEVMEQLQRLWGKDGAKLRAAALRGWAFLFSSLSAPPPPRVLEAQLAALAALLHDPEVEVRAAAGEGLALLYHVCGLGDSDFGDDDASDEADEESEEVEQPQQQQQQQPQQQQPPDPAPASPAGAGGAGGAAPDRGAPVVPLSAVGVLPAAAGAAGAQARRGGDAMSLASASSVSGLDMVIDRVRDLAANRGDRARRSRRDRAALRGTFRELRSVMEDGHVPSQKIKLRHGDTLLINTMEGHVMMNFFRRFIAGGFQVHLQGNPFLHQVFGFSPLEARQERLSAQEKRWLRSPCSAASKARSQARRGQRSAKDAAGDGGDWRSLLTAMAGAGLRLALVALVLLLGASAFKEQDFKKCATNGFCARNRGVTGTKYSVEAGSIKTEGAVLSAVLANTAVPGVRFNLTLISYGPVVRLLVDELPTADHAARYQVPDILLPTLDARATPWTGVTSTAHTWSGKVGAVAVKLTLATFKLEVSVGGKPALVFNGRSMFTMEHPRTKQEGDPENWWAETFNGHTDSKPSGPEAVSIDLAFPGADHVFGIPERATSLALKPTAGPGVESEPYRLYALDVFEYEHSSPFGLYGAIPFLLAHRAGQTVGAFWLNAAEQYVDVESPRGGAAAQWIAESGVLDLFILTGPGPADVVGQYAALTGGTAMPQLFSLGYHQCRWNYKDEADVHAVDAGFDTHAIPYDVLWLDIEHTDGKRYMTWDASLFPNPVAMQEDLASRGRKMVAIVDPHVKRDPGYYIHREAQEKKFYVRKKDGADFDGWCWPGSSSYLDVTSPAVREWWAAQFTPERYVGSTKHLYIWNDMNEPSVFNGPEITMHKDSLHHGDVEHRDVHNIFGYYYHLATAEGLIARGANETLFGPHGDRPFVLSRAFFAGTQRVGPIWTGDNAAQWSHLAVSVPMLLTLGLTGLPFSGADVGGFFGNPDPELLVRWYQLGVFYPFLRGHAHLETQRREPWLFGDDNTRRVRDALRSRYAMLPYIYTLFRHANQTGAPLMRPLWYDFPDQPALFGVEEEFLLGPALLVRPVLQAGAERVSIVLPEGAVWYEALGGGRFVAQRGAAPLDTAVHMESIPVFYRGGHIVPRRERPRRSTATMGSDPFTLVVALDGSGSASGDLYVDDGASFAFAAGHYLHRRFTYARGVLSCDAMPQPTGTPPGTLPSKLTIERIVILGLPEGRAVSATHNGKPLPVTTGAGVDLRLPKGAAVVVRAGGLPLAADWSVKITPGGATATV